MRLPALLLTAAVLAATGCTWVPIAPGASAVRVLPMGAAPAGCEVRAEIEVSVRGKIGFWERNPLRVSEELETLARNEAADLQADTLQPLEAPREYEQRFVTYRCGR